MRTLKNGYGIGNRKDMILQQFCVWFCFQAFLCRGGAFGWVGWGWAFATQFFRDQGQKIPQNCKIRATFMYLLHIFSKFEV